MNLGKEVRFSAIGKEWSLQSFGLYYWMEFCKWCKANLVEDPLADLARLPLERLPRDMIEAKTKEAIELDKQINDYRPESDCTRKRLGTIEGAMHAIYLMAGGDDGKVTKADCGALVTDFASRGRLDELFGYIEKAIGEFPASAEKNVGGPVP